MMVLTIDDTHTVTVDGRALVLHGPVRSKGGRRYDRLDFTAQLPLAAGLVGYGLIRRGEAQRGDASVRLATELAENLKPLLSKSGAAIYFARGGFKITAGIGDFILSNPTQEVSRLKGAEGVIVGYYGSIRQALVAAAEKTIQKCDTTLPYLSLDRTMLHLAKQLWSDLPIDGEHQTHKAHSARPGGYVGSLCPMDRPRTLPTKLKRPRNRQSDVGALQK